MALIGTDFGTALIEGLNSATGSEFLSLLVIIFIITVLCLGLRIPIEFTAVFVLPLLLVVATYTSSIMPVLGVFLIYLGFLVGKNLLR